MTDASIENSHLHFIDIYVLFTFALNCLLQKKREKKANKVHGNKNTEAACLMMRLTATKGRNKNKMEPTHV